jgi:MinD superfamily P-loop ATPase
VVAVDLDVEEPNLHLFMNPEWTGRQDALMEVPRVHEESATTAASALTCASSRPYRCCRRW